MKLVVRDRKSIKQCLKQDRGLFFPHRNIGNAGLVWGIQSPGTQVPSIVQFCHPQHALTHAPKQLLRPQSSQPYSIQQAGGRSKEWIAPFVQGQFSEVASTASANIPFRQYITTVPHLDGRETRTHRLSSEQLVPSVLSQGFLAVSTIGLKHSSLRSQRWNTSGY